MESLKIYETYMHLGQISDTGKKAPAFMWSEILGLSSTYLQFGHFVCILNISAVRRSDI